MTDFSAILKVIVPLAIFAAMVIASWVTTSRHKPVPSGRPFRNAQNPATSVVEVMKRSA